MKRAPFFRYKRLLVFTSDLEALAASPSDNSGRFEFAWIHDEAGVNRTAEITRKKTGLYVSIMQTTLAAGGRVAVALEAGKPVSLQMFLPQEQVTIPWLRVRANDAVFGFASYTAQGWRGHRLMTHVAKFAAATYAGEKFRRLCSMAQPVNKRAVRAHLNRGDRPVGWIAGLRLPRGPMFVASDRRIDCGFFNDSNPFVYTVRD